MVTATSQGHCSRCGKVWTLEKAQGVCQWCGKPAICQTTRTTALRSIKSSSRRRRRQAHNGNGYHQLKGEWLTYYQVASKHASKAMAQDREDLLHTIILTLAVAERKNGHKPFTIGTMHRIASRAVYDYWRGYHRLTNGIDCGNCSKAQRRKCKDNWLYGECPKAIKLESLDKPILDSEGNVTTLGEVIADPKSLDLDAWDRDSLWQLSYKPRLVAIALKLHTGDKLDWKDYKYLERYRQAQKRLF